MTFGTLQITVPIIVSFITSVIVTVFGFVVGARIAKDRADRGGIRELYKSAYFHFRAMKDSIRAGRPRTWNDYQTPRRDGSPLIYEYIRNGTLNQFPKKIAEACEKMEKDTLVFGWNFRSSMEKNFGKKLLAWSAKNLNAAEQPISGRSYVRYPAGKLFLEEKPFEEIAKYVDLENLGVEIELSIESRTYPVYLMPEKIIDGDVKTAIAEVRALVEGEEETQKACRDLKHAEAQLTDLLTALASRIKDPHPIGETIAGSLRDIFRL